MFFLRRGKGTKPPFLQNTILPVFFLILLLFGRKKPLPQDSPRIETDKSRDLKEPFPVPESLSKTITELDMNRARDKLRVASLERDIIGDALTKIYEAEARGQINETEKNGLVQRYKVDLKRVDGEIGLQKRVVDLHELESAKEDLLKSFYEKLMEIDLRIGQLKPGIESIIPVSTETKLARQPTPLTESSASVAKEPSPQPQTPQPEKTVKERPKTKAEERLEAIKEEVLKAMERLEQIETEG